MANNKAYFALKRGPSTKLDGLNIKDGSFIVTTDKHQLYVDVGTERHLLSDIHVVDALPAIGIDENKFYFLTTDNSFYRYTKKSDDEGYEWVNTTTTAVESISEAVDEAKAAAQAVAEAVSDLDKSLSGVAKSGAAADVSIVDNGGFYEATDVEGALAELAGQIGTTGEAGKVVVEEISDPGDYAKVYHVKQNGVKVGAAINIPKAPVLTVTESTSDDFAKVYTIKHGDDSVGTINVPKDMVVEDGEVVTLPEADDKGHVAGTYMKLTLANAANKELWIPVGGLIEYVTGGATAEITVSVDPITHVATAVINDASIGKTKLTADVQTSLGLADTAVQSVTVMGTELKNGDELTVEQAKTALGLGSAAYTGSDAYDTAGAAADAKAAVIGTVDDDADANTINGAKAYATAAVTDAITWIDFGDE